MKKTAFLVPIIAFVMMGAIVREPETESLVLSDTYKEPIVVSSEETEETRIILPKNIPVYVPDDFEQSIRPTELPWQLTVNVPSWYWYKEQENYNEAYILWYLTAHGYSEEAACGIVANISAETGGSFDPNTCAVDGSYGLCQWIGDRLKELKTWDSYDTLDTQLDYILHELETDNPVDLSGNAYECGYNVSLYFERPLAGKSAARYRGQIAEEIYDSLH